MDTSRQAGEPIGSAASSLAEEVGLVGQSERNQNTRTEAFSLTVDQYGRLWLHSKLEGIEVAIDLGEKEEAFQIMAAVMDEQKFDYRPAEPEHDGQADNDDELRR